MKRILLGDSPEKVASRDALADPGAIDAFVSYAGERRVEEQRRDDGAGLGRRLIPVRVGAVEQVPAVHQRRRAAAVEVDRLVGAERDHQPGELGEREPSVHARAAPVAADREKLVLVHAERAARVPADRDVGVELLRVVGEALAVLAVDERAPAGHEQRAGLHEVAARLGREVLPRGDPDVAVEVHAGALGAPSAHDRLVRDGRAVHPRLAQRPPGVAHEEAGHDRLGMAVRGTPVIEAARLAEMHDPRGGLGARVPDEIDGGVLAVAEADACELVGAAAGHRRDG